ncbi:MAG: helix-turn-helix domain-containing protein [bacterium]
MVGFFSKKVSDQENLGEHLITARQKQKIPLKNIARQLAINEDYLQALEKGEYDRLPGSIYAKSFLKVYAEFLKLDQTKILELYSQEMELRQKVGQVGEEAPRMVKRVTISRLAITPKIIRRSLIILVIIIFLAYLAWELKSIITPPFLTIDQPANNFITKDYSVEISGSTEQEAKLVINGQELMANKDGHFTKRLDLQAGVNTITISAEKKYSQPKVVYLSVLVDNPVE